MRKEDYYTQKPEILSQIEDIYHSHNGVDGYRSMSRAEYPYDNAPMEGYVNTLKNECTNLYGFQTEEALCHTMAEFAYVTYNHVRPHSFNGYRTFYQARISS